MQQVSWGAGPDCLVRPILTTRLYCLCFLKPCFFPTLAGFHISNTMHCPKWASPVILTLGSLNLWRSSRAAMKHHGLFSTSKISNVYCRLPSDQLAQTDSEVSLCLDYSECLHFAGHLDLEWHLSALSRLAIHFHERGDGIGTWYTFINKSG